MTKDLLTLALGGFAGLFAGLALAASQAAEHEVKAELTGSVLVGSQCEAAPAGSLVIMAEEDGWGAPCKEIARRVVSIELDGGPDA